MNKVTEELYRVQLELDLWKQAFRNLLLRADVLRREGEGDMREIEEVAKRMKEEAQNES